MRAPKLTKRDIIKAIKKIKNMLSSLSTSEEKQGEKHNIRVCQPLMLPYLSLPGIRLLNNRSVVRHVRKKLNTHNMNSPIMVVTAPNACDYINHFNEKCVVYYCVDDFSEWPGVNKKLVKDMEDKLLNKSDVFIATSQNLYENIKIKGKKANLLTHGVDIKVFSTVQGKEHGLLTDIPKPRVGYFGLFDDRSNKRLLMEVAKLLPEMSFVITGEIETDISQLQKLNNIYFTGSVPYVELPEIARGYDICMLPYKINKLTDSIQPLKFKEYLATGKPIISTPIKEAIKLKEYLDIADTAEQWAELIRGNLISPSQIAREKRSLFIKSESWEEKSEQFLRFIFNPDTHCQ
jgi:glycosyltransferase involved in cell wall biosynthesis